VNGSGTHAETRNSSADVSSARVIRSWSSCVRPPACPFASASTSRVTARLIANTVTSPVEAGSTATAATPAGTLPARNSSRCSGASAPWRL
jgi:hypothetical protein